MTVSIPIQSSECSICPQRSPQAHFKALVAQQCFFLIVSFLSEIDDALRVVHSGICTALSYICF